MKKEIKVGCCGFPVSHKKYFQVFNCIEINITFYQIPEINTAAKLKEGALSYNKDFEFIIKAWQLITHPSSSFTYRRLKEKIPENRKKYCGYFQPSDEVFNAWERTKEFADKLDCNKILFQTPSSFKPTDNNKNNIINFFNYINKYSKGYHFIWEARGNWGTEEIKEICKKLNLTHCVDPLSPNLNNSVHGKFNYFRIHGNYIGSKINYNHKIENEAMNRIFLSCDRNINYVMFNNSYMFEDALTFMNNYT